MSIGVNKIQAGRSLVGYVLQLQVGNLQPSSPQRGQPQVGGDLAAVQQRFGAEGRVVEHLKIVEIESGAGQQPKIYRSDLDLTAKSLAQSGGQLPAEASSIYFWRQENRE